jgi:flavin reductase (DIM6/NTAB) family NADH-FMN oxidoreductase RutF
VSIRYTPQRLMPIDESQFKLAMSHFASGVTIVTTQHEGTPYGITVASFASLSLRPPLVVICIEKAAKSHDAIAAAKKFGVSILEEKQAEISGRFASKTDDKFAGVDLKEGRLGIPLIAGSLCMLECNLRDRFAGGDHSVFVGEVVEAYIGAGSPLVYYRSSYRHINA